MTPNITQFKSLARGANVIPVFTELLADMETPVSIFAKLPRNISAFLLESAENVDNWGRYSFIGCNPRAEFRLRGNLGELAFKSGKLIRSPENAEGMEALSPLRDYLAGRKIAELPELPRFFGGAVGYFGYECVNLFEKLPPPKGEMEWDDARFGLYDDVIIFDNIHHTAKIVACAHTDDFDSLEEAYADASSRVSELIKLFRSESKAGIAESRDIDTAREVFMRSEMDGSSYMEMVERAKEYIRSGEIIQVVLSRKFGVKANITPLSAYRALRLINPSPYMFCFRDAEGSCLVGSSPETLIRLCDGKVQVRPIAGTRSRGSDKNEDIKLASELLANEKERAEHLMLVDLGRNDISRFCYAGSVQVSDFMSIERYSHVMHMVSTVNGEAKPGVDAFDALAAVFPAGTLSGAPKVRAMQIINELESCRRGPYGGAAGYIGYGGNMDMAITIRTLQMRGNALTVQAGAGIVYDSNPDAELEETRIKAQAVSKAVKIAGGIDSLAVDSIGR